MGSISEDEGLVEAALAEVLAKPLDVRERLGGQDLDRFLIQHHLGNVSRPRRFCLPLEPPSAGIDSSSPLLARWPQNDVAAARSVLTQAIHIRPGAPESLGDLAKLFLQENNLVMGRKMAQAAVDADRHLETGWKAALLRSVATFAGGDALVDGDTLEEAQAKRKQAVRDAQRVLLSRPFDQDAWRVVEMGRARSA